MDAEMGVAEYMTLVEAGREPHWTPPFNVRPVFTQEALRELRDDEDWHGGAMCLIVYPSAPAVGFIGHELPLVMHGVRIEPGPGVYVIKGEAGDFAVWGKMPGGEHGLLESVSKVTEQTHA